MGKCVAVMYSRSVKCVLFAIINILFNIIIVMKLRNVTDLLPSFCLLGISDYVCTHFVYINLLNIYRNSPAITLFVILDR
jgi:hypothetical protein